MTAIDKAGRLFGRFLAAVGAGMRDAGAAPKATEVERAYRVALLDEDLDPDLVAAVQVMAGSPEQAAERRAGAAAERLHAAKKAPSRLFRVLVEWPDGGRTETRKLTVGAALMIKTEVIDESSGGPTWGGTGAP